MNALTSKTTVVTVASVGVVLAGIAYAIYTGDMQKVYLLLQQLLQMINQQPVPVPLPHADIISATAFGTLAYNFSAHKFADQFVCWMYKKGKRLASLPMGDDVNAYWKRATEKVKLIITELRAVGYSDSDIRLLLETTELDDKKSYRSCNVVDRAMGLKPFARS